AQPCASASCFDLATEASRLLYGTVPFLRPEYGVAPTPCVDMRSLGRTPVAASDLDTIAAPSDSRCVCPRPEAGDTFATRGSNPISVSGSRTSVWELALRPARTSRPANIRTLSG